MDSPRRESTVYVTDESTSSPCATLRRRRTRAGQCTTVIIFRDSLSRESDHNVSVGVVYKFISSFFINMDFFLYHFKDKLLAVTRETMSMNFFSRHVVLSFQIGRSAKLEVAFYL